MRDVHSVIRSEIPADAVLSTPESTEKLFQGRRYILYKTREDMLGNWRIVAKSIYFLALLLPALFHKDCKQLAAQQWRECRSGKETVHYYVLSEILPTDDSTWTEEDRAYIQNNVKQRELIFKINEMYPEFIKTELLALIKKDRQVHHYLENLMSMMDLSRNIMRENVSGNLVLMEFMLTISAEERPKILSHAAALYLNHPNRPFRHDIFNLIADTSEEKRPNLVAHAAYLYELSSKMPVLNVDILKVIEHIPPEEGPELLELAHFFKYSVHTDGKVKFAFKNHIEIISALADVPVHKRKKVVTEALRFCEAYQIGCIYQTKVIAQLSKVPDEELAEVGQGAWDFYQALLSKDQKIAPELSTPALTTSTPADILESVISLKPEDRKHAIEYANTVLEESPASSWNHKPHKNLLLRLGEVKDPYGIAKLNHAHIRSVAWGLIELKDLIYSEVRQQNAVLVLTNGKNNVKDIIRYPELLDHGLKEWGRRA